MSDGMSIVLVAALLGTATGLLGPFLVLRRVSLMADAVTHAVLPGIVGVYLVLGTRAPLAMALGATLFAVICVLAVDALRSTGLIRSDAAIGLVFPALFSLGVLGVTKYADGIHLDLDATIYGEIAFTPFDRYALLPGIVVPQAAVVLGLVCLLNLAIVVALWKEIKATTFDPEFAQTIGISPTLVSRLLLVATAITAVAAFESVGAILVVTLIIVPAATAALLTDRLWAMVALAVGIGWVAAVFGYLGALELDASIGGGMGVVAGLCFIVALLASRRYGLVAVSLRRRRARAAARSSAPRPA